MKYRSIIIEDESLARQRLKLLLQKHAEVIEIIAEAENGVIALEKINEYKPDLIFLDIQVPGLTGFEVLSRLKYIPLVIFTTAFDEYALQAFETYAIDYLMKPITPARLRKAIDKLQNITGKEKEFEDKITALIKGFHQSDTSYIKVKIGQITKLVDYNEIYYFGSEDKYTCLHTKAKKYIISESLSNLEKELPYQFKRIHRATIINLDHVKEIVHLSRKKSVVVLKDNFSTELIVSRRMRKALL